MPKQETIDMMNKMVKHAEEFGEVYPYQFQPYFGRDNTVSAAIRVAKNRGLLEQSDELDGCGNPIYVIPPEPNVNSPWYMEKV